MLQKSAILEQQIPNKTKNQKPNGFNASLNRNLLRVPFMNLFSHSNFNKNSIDNRKSRLKDAEDNLVSQINLSVSKTVSFIANKDTNNIHAKSNRDIENLENVNLSQIAMNSPLNITDVKTNSISSESSFLLPLNDNKTIITITDTIMPTTTMMPTTTSLNQKINKSTLDSKLEINKELFTSIQFEEKIIMQSNTSNLKIENQTIESDKKSLFTNSKNTKTSTLSNFTNLTILHSPLVTTINLTEKIPTINTTTISTLTTKELLESEISSMITENKLIDTTLTSISTESQKNVIIESEKEFTKSLNTTELLQKLQFNAEILKKEISNNFK